MPSLIALLVDDFHGAAHPCLLPWCAHTYRYYDLKAADLGELVKLPRMGKTLHRLVHQFPRVELAASVQPITRGLLRVELTITPDFLFDQKVWMHACPKSEIVCVCVF